MKIDQHDCRTSDTQQSKLCRRNVTLFMSRRQLKHSIVHSKWNATNAISGRKDVCRISHIEI